MFLNSKSAILLRQCIFTNLKLLNNFSSKVPETPQTFIDLNKLPPQTKIDQDTIEQLEKVSLVKFKNEKGIQIVEESIRFADQITLLNTDGVEPLYSVLEKRSLPLREDNVTEVECKEGILKNSKVLEEDYFVAPPGNIPLETENYLTRTSKN